MNKLFLVLSLIIIGLFSLVILYMIEENRPAVSFYAIGMIFILSINHFYIKYKELD